MIGALWTGISGLASHQKALDNESHNIANVNTVGYKASRISFADQMYQDRIGKGSKILDAEKLYVQGNLKVTGVSLDMALSGTGFFAVSNTRSSGTSETYYTRAGNFRMGDNGTLQDASGNEVQGWAMSSIDPDVDVISSNPNISVFTGDYTKLISSKVVQHSNYVETITAKASDYTQSAKADPSVIYSGYGLKTQSGKVADIETLITDYSTWLQKLKETPDGASSTSIAQTSYIDMPSKGAAGAIATEGDQAYIYLNGNKISQNWDTDYATTMRKLADKISAVPGFKAFTANDTAGVYASSTSTTDLTTGALRIEALVPGVQFTITEVGMISSNTTTQGSSGELVSAVKGSGIGALQTSMAALEKAIVGKQQDVYQASDLLTLDATTGNVSGTQTLTYSLSIYDKDIKQNVTVSTPAISVTAVAGTNPQAAIDAIVAQINTNTTTTGELADYIKAYNINGALVIKTLDSNFDVEFTGSMNKTTAISETQTLTLSGVATGAVSFLGTAIAGSAVGDTAAITAGRIVTDKANLMSAWNTANPTKEISDITNVGAALTITYKNTEGDVAELSATTSAGITFPLAGETAKGHAAGVIKRNADYSGREGAGAEFIQIATKIDQTASKGSLQLRLDTLDISDSAFGEFAVDSTGLITMKQDGAEFAIGQVAIALFNNERGLEPTGDNLLKTTNESGDPIYNVNNDKTAKIEGKTLELSTADLSESLVNLMVFQRAFEANAKSITTSDELLNTLINLKR